VLPEAEYIALRDHIKANGLQNPIVLFEEQILCGIHRDKACRELGIEAKYVRPEIKDPFEYAIGDNERRRGQLTELQRIETAEKMANLKLGSNQYKKVGPSNEASISISQERAAKLNGVSLSSVQRFKRVRNETIPEVLDAVRLGEVALPRASDTIARLPKEPKELQLAALKEAKTRTKRRVNGSSRESNKSASTNWKNNPAYVALETKSLAGINAPSIYPTDLPLPVNGHNAHIEAKVQAHIRELKTAEPKIAQMSQRELGEEVYVHVQFIQTYGMEPDGMRVTGPIDKRWIDWAKNVATKMQLRKIILLEQAKYRQLAKSAKTETKRSSRKEKDEPVLELQWKKFQGKLKEAIQLFHRDDGAEVIRRTVDFLEKHFAPRQ